MDGVFEDWFANKKSTFKMKKIIINPNINIQYAAFYIKGLQTVYGKKNISFADKSNIELFVFFDKMSCFSFLVIDDEKKQTIKVAIDYGDFNTIIENGVYEWSDIYGKVNTNWKITPKNEYPKIVCLATNFGIRSFTFLESIISSIRNYSIVKPKNKKRYFAQYLKQKNKLWIDQYPQSQSQNGYVFSVNTLWFSDEWNRMNETTNKIRAEFMEICLSMTDIVFEGGFISSDLGNKNYIHLQLKQRLTQKQYVDKLKKSIIAFNTPAVWNCHGWKLGEFLCMGKAIISTPLSNDLPSPLIHGESIHIVNSQQELIEAIQLLNDNIEYRKKIERGARMYYEKYGSPEAAIKLLGIA